MEKMLRSHLRLEQHFLIDWTLNYKESEIRTAIRTFKWPLIVRKMEPHPLYVNDTERVQVISKLYRPYKVDDFRGKTAFNMYFLYDTDPKYDLRVTSKGKRLVNTAMFDLQSFLKVGAAGNEF